MQPVQGVAQHVRQILRHPETFLPNDNEYSIHLIATHATETVGKRPKRAATAVMIGILLASLDGAIVNLALPNIGTAFSAQPSAAIWVANAYQLAGAACILIFASLGQLSGSRNVFAGGLIAFIVASLGCSLSPTLPWLIAARVLQGISYAAMVSVGIGLYRKIFPPQLLGTLLGINALVVSLGTAVGPALGGLIISYASWPWLFLINIPPGLLAVFLAYAALPNEPSATGRFDYPGALASALGIGLLVAVVQEFNHLQVVERVFACALIVSLCTLFIFRQARTCYPLLALDIFKSTRFNLAVASSITLFVAQGLAIVTVPFELERDDGYSVLQAAMLFTPWPLSICVLAPLAGRLSRRVRATALSTLGAFLFAAGLASLAFLTPDQDAFTILWRTAMCGIGYGLFLPPNNKAMFDNASGDRSFAVSGVLSTARTLGQSIGGALAAVLLLSGSSPTNGFQHCFAAASLLAVTAGCISFFRRATVS